MNKKQKRNKNIMKNVCWGIKKIGGGNLGIIQKTARFLVFVININRTL